MHEARQQALFTGLTLWVLVPLLVLAGLAVWGLRAQKQAVWADAAERAQQLVRQHSAKIDEGLKSDALLHRVRFYPALPQPAIGAPDLTERSLEELMQIRDDPNEQGFSTSGMPLRALAAWRVYQEEANNENAHALADIALTQAPSLVTPRLLEQAGDHVREGWQETWKHDEAIREALNEVPHRVGLIARDDVWWVTERTENYADVVSFSSLAKVAGQDTNMIRPPWLNLEVSTFGKPLTEVSDGKVLASHSGDRHVVTAKLSGPNQLLASYHRQVRWTIGLIAVATLSACLGLFFTHRAMRRERRLNELKSHFVSSVSHELRAPVASMRLMAEALDEGKVTEPEKRAEFYRLMAGEGARLTALIENVLDFARIEQNRKTYHFAECDVEALVAETVALIEPQAAAREIHIETQMDTLPFQPSVDALALQQAMINLLDNAIKFSPSQSAINVRLAPNGDSWFLAVQDRGPGIPKEDRERIFERFTRLEDEMRRETQGAGIGLSLVHHIVKAHQGRVTIEDRNQKGGSVFAMHFPRPETIT